MGEITLNQLEAAINYWRNRSPSVGEELRLCPEAAALARPYALMILQRQARIAADALDPRAQAALQGAQQG